MFAEAHYVDPDFKGIHEALTLTGLLNARGDMAPSAGESPETSICNVIDGTERGLKVTSTAESLSPAAAGVRQAQLYKRFLASFY